jgi:hypothetical protein
MHRPIKYVEKGLTYAAKGAWANRLTAWERTGDARGRIGSECNRRGDHRQHGEERLAFSQLSVLAEPSGEDAGQLVNFVAA